MRLASIILISLALSAARCDDCGPNCVSCTQSHCLTCYNTPFAGGSPSQCKTDAVPANNCDLYFNTQKGCQWCRQGYYFTVNSGADNCNQIPAGQQIQNCVNQVSSPGGYVCGVCNGGFPNLTFSSCSAFSESNPVSDNCLWGYRVPGQHNQCFRCKPGYVNVSGGCEALGGAGTQWEGCLATDNNRKVCGLCDAWNGYRQINNNAQCSKASNGSNGSQESLMDLFNKGISAAEVEFLREKLIKFA